MKEFILRYWMEALFGAIVASLGLCYKALSKKVQKQIADRKSLREGTQALLRNELIKEYDKYMERGWIPVYGMENVTSMYNAYHSLGGNGAITKLIDELNELPSKKVKPVTEP